MDRQTEKPTHHSQVSEGLELEGKPERRSEFESPSNTFRYTANVFATRESQPSRRSQAGQISLLTKQKTKEEYPYLSERVPKITAPNNTPAM